MLLRPALEEIERNVIPATLLYYKQLSRKSKWLLVLEQKLTDTAEQLAFALNNESIPITTFADSISRIYTSLSDDFVHDKIHSLPLLSEEELSQVLNNVNIYEPNTRSAMNVIIKFLWSMYSKLI